MSLFSSANTDPNHLTAFVSGQLGFRKKLQIGLKIVQTHNAQGIMFLSAFLVGLSNKSE